MLVPNAFLVHPVLAAVAEDAVAAQSSATDSTWKLAWALQEVQARTTYDLHLSCIYSLSFLLHCFFPSQEPPDRFLKRFSDDNKVISVGPASGPHSGIRMTRPQAQWWRAVGWVPSLGEHRPSLQTLHCTPHQHKHGSVHWHTSPTPVAQSTPPHQVFSVPTRWPSVALTQTPSPGLRKPCRVSCWHLDICLTAAWQQRLHLLCLCLGQSKSGNRRLTPTVWWGRPQSSLGLSWPALSAWDGGSCPFLMHPPFPCRGRQKNSAP